MLGRDADGLRRGIGDHVDIADATRAGEGVGIARIDDDRETVPRLVGQVRQLCPGSRAPRPNVWRSA
jgi:hypothetical protein